MTVSTKETGEAKVSGLATILHVISLRRGDGRNDLISGRVLKTKAGIISGVDDGTVSADRRYGDVVDRVEHSNISADSVPHVKEPVGRIHPADIEEVERAAGRARGAVSRYRHHVNQADRRVLVRSAHRTIRRAARATGGQTNQSEQHSQRKAGQPLRLHRDSSCDIFQRAI